MSHQPSKTEDMNLGLALMISLACGVASFWYSYTTSFDLLWLSGLVKIRFLDYPAASKSQGIPVLRVAFGVVGVSLCLGILVAYLVFRLINQWMKNSSSRVS